MPKIVIKKLFKRDLRRASRRGKDLNKINAVIEALANQQPLAAHHRDHLLIGNYSGLRECHIEPDWLLVYELDNSADALRLCTGCTICRIKHGMTHLHPQKQV